MEAGKRTINDIFNGNRVLEIPFFQRAYVWEEEQWERLLEDMEFVSQSKTILFRFSHSKTRDYSYWKSSW